MRERAGWLDVDGPVHYVEWLPDDADGAGRAGAGGDGPAPLVLVHGLSGAHANWLGMVPHLLGTGRRVLALDLPGHGLTRPGARDTTLPGMGRVLDAFVDRVVEGRAVLVGNSMGGLLSALQASRRPETTEALALLAPAVPIGRARMHPVTAVGFAGYAVPGVGELVVSARRRRSTPEQLVAQSLWMTCADPSRVPADVVERHVDLVRARAGFRRLDPAFLSTARTLLRTLARPAAVRRALDDVQCPVLLVQGDRDRLVPVAAARAAARQHPQWRYVELPGVGHVPMLEAAEQTADLLTGWLGDVAAGGAPRSSAPAQRG